MSLMLTGLKVAPSQLARVSASYPAMAAVGVGAAGGIGYLAAESKLGTATEVYSVPVDSGVINITATSVVFLAGLGVVIAGVPIAVSATAIALGMVGLAALLDPGLADSIFERAYEIQKELEKKIASGEIAIGEVTPVDLSKWIEPEALNGNVNICYRDAKIWRSPVDPLMLDLDGDGLELKSASSAVLFDDNADDIRTGTGWIGPDDGILVRDLDGNGTIDSGRELFGDQTVKSSGQKALSGFDALRDLDSNADGNFTAADVAELFTLKQLGISRIDVVDGTAGWPKNPTIGKFRNIRCMAPRRSVASLRYD